MSGVQAYSIWIIPPGSVYTTLVTLIRQLAKQYATPLFEPHLTLLGNIASSEEEVTSKAFRLATTIRPFDIRLGRVSYLDEYFRSLFVSVEEAKEIMTANKQAREIFDRLCDPIYMPHLSLMYGNITHEEKQRIISDIGNNFNIRFSVKSFHVVSASSNADPVDWRRLQEFAFME